MLPKIWMGWLLPVGVCLAGPPDESQMPLDPAPCPAPILSEKPLRSEEITFQDADTVLAGVLVLPEGPGPFPTVVFIHGSGPATREYFGYYRPLWREFTRRGFACLSWDKPGMGNSSGDYTRQRWVSCARALEAVAAIQFLKGRRDIDPRRIGLWGISQAGWVMPQICALSPGIAFMISVSGAGGTVAAQDRYRQINSLRAQGCPPEEIEQISAFRVKLDAALQAPVAYEEFRRLVQQARQAPWAPRLKKMGFDLDSFDQLGQAGYALNCLVAKLDRPPLLEKMHCPVLAIFGEDDKFVDARESARVYREVLTQAGNKDVTIHMYPHADHSIFLTNGGIPKWTLAPGYLELMSNWLVQRFGPGAESKPAR